MLATYQFGKIEVAGKTFRSDVIIYPDRVIDSWWRKEGHSLAMEDIKEVLDFKPDVLVIGQGKPGLMKVPELIRQEIKEQGIELFISGTERAVKEFNSLRSEKRRAVAALHLTC
jgi:hypothetical protein